MIEEVAVHISHSTSAASGNEDGGPCGFPWLREARGLDQLPLRLATIYLIASFFSFHRAPSMNFIFWSILIEDYPIIIQLVEEGVVDANVMVLMRNVDPGMAGTLDA